MRLLCLASLIMATMAGPPTAAARLHPCPNPDHRPAEPQSKTRCTLRVAGVPRTMLPSLTVRVGRSTIPLADTREVSFEFTGASADVRVSSPRFVAQRTVTTGECRLGTVEFEVAPRPAKLRILGIPTDAVVVCTAGCGSKITGRNYLAGRFPDLALGTDIQAKVDLRLRHADYLPLTTTALLLPGTNELVLQMQPRCP